MILVDVNEPDTVRHMLNLEGVEISNIKLDIGDYTNEDKTFVVERKTTTDYYKSLIEKRLDIQLGNIQEKANSFLIIEGSIKDVMKYVDNKRRQLSYMYAKIIEICMRYGVHIIMTQNTIETAIVLKWIDHYSEVIHEIKEVHVRIRSVDPKIGSLMQIPYVGKDTAKNLLDRFNCIRNIFNASEYMLKKVKGVGPKTAKSIVDFGRT